MRSNKTAKRRILIPESKPILPTNSANYGKRDLDGVILNIKIRKIYLRNLSTFQVLFLNLNFRICSCAQFSSFQLSSTEAWNLPIVWGLDPDINV